MSACPICLRPSDNSAENFCKYHKWAYESLKRVFQEWTRAINISWEDYLREIGSLDTTGRWVLDVIEYLNSQDDSSRH